MDFNNKWADHQHHHHQQPQQQNPPQNDPYAPFYSAQQPYSHYPYYPQNPTSSIPQTGPIPLNPSSAQKDSGAVAAPGTDPYASYEKGTDPYASNPYMGLDPQAVQYGHTQMQASAIASYYQDPNAAMQYGAEHLGYGAAVMAPINPTPTFQANRFIRPFANGASKWGPKKTKVVQSAWCEICKIECSSQVVLDQHKLGRKHKNNLKKQQELKNDASPLSSTKLKNPVVGNKEVPSGEKGKIVGGKTRNDSSMMDLETKKQKIMEEGAAADAVRMCEICNIVVNSQTVLNFHLTGQKHAIQAAKLQIGMQPMAQPNPRRKNQIIHLLANGATRKGPKKGPKKIKVVQSTWCEICKIECNSKDVLDKHKLGKKHMKNLQKLEEPKKDTNTTAPAPASAAEEPKDPAVGEGKEISLEDKGKAVGGQTRKGAPADEDLETKRRKIMEKGAAPESVRFCEVCNIVCNSQTVLNYHLAGSKHAAQLKKQEEETTASEEATTQALLAATT
eukprot:TRINITY_DN8465_c0_g1_i1.p1 TRINITY_DN8465_c0_g1~~TRINITY_DN8465_c0_g1_i1.p1  ORF type:complete len:504 (+),score=82.36 TRINITY_DN8465_c0_g1_i1:167-1678(+)